MTDTGVSGGPWLRPLPGPGVSGDGRDAPARRGGCLVLPSRRLSQIVQRRPPGVTAHQWNVALRTHVDFVVYDAHSHAPVFVAAFTDGGERTVEGHRAERMTQVVCEAVGLGLLRVESPVLAAEPHGRRLVDYVIDARAFAAVAGDDPLVEPVSFREILGRLPDGRTGFVNDLGAVARVAAVEAYAERRLVDPIIRGLHACWRDGPAEGWAWLEVRDGQCLFERVRLWQHGFSCGVDPGRLAEDLAAAAIGERLKHLDAGEPTLVPRDRLARDLRELHARRDELHSAFTFAHVTFD